MEEKKPAPAPSVLLPTLSPEEVHKNIMRCHTLRNRVDLRTLEWLHVLIAYNYCRHFDSPGPVHYVMQNLKSLSQ